MIEFLKKIIAIIANMDQIDWIITICVFIICDASVVIYKLFTLLVTLRLEEIEIILTLIPEKTLTVQEVYSNAKAAVEKKRKKRRLLIRNWIQRLLIMIVIIIIIRDPPDEPNIEGVLFDYIGSLIPNVHLN